MANGNGEAKIVAGDVSDRALLEVVLEAITQLTEKLEDIEAKQDSLAEAVANISTPGVDYETEDDF